MRQAVAVYVRSAPLASSVQLVATVVPGLAPAATAWLTGRLLDHLAGNDHTGVTACALALAALGALTAFAVHLERYAGTEIARRVALTTQAELFTALGRRQGLQEIEDPEFQDRLRLAQQSSQSGPRQLVTSALGIEQAALTVLGFMAVLIGVSPLIAALVLVSTAPMVWGQFSLSRQRTGMLRRSAPRLRRQLFYALLLTDLRAAKEIRLFGIGRFLRSRMLGELRAAQACEREVDRATLRVNATFSLLAAAVSGGALVVAALRIGNGPAGIGGMTVLIMALASIQPALAGIAEQAGGMNQATTMFGHYAALVREPAEAAVRRPDAPPPTSGIEVRDVWFRYHPDHPWILQGVSLRIEPGQSLALVGLNGAGKSTLVKLICGMYEPTEGAVLWDGIDIRELDAATLRARISAVFQDFMCYEMSAAENIAIGDLDAVDDEPRLREAASRTGVDRVLSELPLGYRTMLSRIFAIEQPTDSTEAGASASMIGVTLSGGQWQRVALARALLRTEADLLILDEPASGLDARAESEIAASLRERRAGRSSLLISHRLNTVRDADHIVVLEHGRIIEEGIHEKLMLLGGAYAQLFRVQAAGYQLGSATCGCGKPC